MEIRLWGFYELSGRKETTEENKSHSGEPGGMYLTSKADTGKTTWPTTEDPQ